jgi:hypothetical protein
MNSLRCTCWMVYPCLLKDFMIHLLHFEIWTIKSVLDSLPSNKKKCVRSDAIIADVRLTRVREGALMKVVWCSNCGLLKCKLPIQIKLSGKQESMQVTLVHYQHRDNKWWKDLTIIPILKKDMDCKRKALIASKSALISNKENKHHCQHWEQII